ncbi:MAG: hypothetical protein Q4G68_09460 [Planctomycetia bacterium]|nr:hypothetical protein [Planctomycetia bacterium]
MRKIMINDKTNRRRDTGATLWLNGALLAAGFCLLCGCQSVKLPNVMTESPSLTEIQQAVNANSSKIQTLQADNATVGVTSMPGWAKCRVAYQRPGRIRVRGTANMMGPVIDTGCNDQVFWYWSKMTEPSQLSWCRLEEFSTSPFSQMITIDPAMFPEALGVVEFKTTDVTEGPIAQQDRTLLLTTKVQRADGVYTKCTYVEPKTAAVKRQDLLNPSGNVVLSINCTEFQYDSVAGVVLPKRITIARPQTNESIHLDLGTMVVNGTGNLTAQTFEMPSSADLGNVPVVEVGKMTTTTGQVPTAAVPVAAPGSPSYTAGAAQPAPSPSGPTAQPANQTAYNAASTSLTPGAANRLAPFGDFPGVTRGPAITSSSASNPTTYPPAGESKPLFTGTVAGMPAWNSNTTPTSAPNTAAPAEKIVPGSPQDYASTYNNAAQVPAVQPPAAQVPAAASNQGLAPVPVSPAASAAPPINGAMPGTYSREPMEGSTYYNNILNTSPATTSDHMRTQVLAP